MSVLTSRKGPYEDAQFATILTFLAGSDATSYIYTFDTHWFMHLDPDGWMQSHHRAGIARTIRDCLHRAAAARGVAGQYDCLVSYEFIDRRGTGTITCTVFKVAPDLPVYSKNDDSP